MTLITHLNFFEEKPSNVAWKNFSQVVCGEDTKQAFSGPISTKCGDHINLASYIFLFQKPTNAITLIFIDSVYGSTQLLPVNIKLSPGWEI